MANSPFQDTVFVMKFLHSLEPESVLDVGAGFGRWGFLCRCHLGPGESLTTTPDQKPIIDAVEFFPRNVNPVYDAVYNHTWQGDIVEILPSLGMYDVILCGHMIEHFEKGIAWRLIEGLSAHARKAVVICLPFYDSLRGPVCGNEREAHLSMWIPSDFRGKASVVKEFSSIGRTTAGVVILTMTRESQWIARVTASPWRGVFSRIKVGWQRMKL